MNLYLGFDFGTSGVRTVLIDIDIVIARAIRTLNVEHTPWHRLDNQTGRVPYEFDF